MSMAYELTNFYIGQLKLIYAQNAPQAQDGLAGVLLEIQKLASRRGDKGIVVHDGVCVANGQVSALRVNSSVKFG